MVLLLRAPVAQHPDALRAYSGLSVVDHAAFAVGAEVLAGVEAEARHVAEAADAAALVFGAVRLRRVLDDDQAVSPRDRRGSDPCRPAGRRGGPE